ncbi:MAG: bifunctional adenosylcobinamide kinase/adenosylcobinamide-phosphate guanylyltransferase [Cyanobacteria bacterium P01_F01_bin.150]
MNTRKSPESPQESNNPQRLQPWLQPQSVVLVTGPARSGKSEWAESLALAAEHQGKSIVYVATSVLNNDDQEWLTRIDLHRQRRPASWSCIEGPVDLVEVIETADGSSCLLIDSLGTWIANELESDAKAWDSLITNLLGAIASTPATLIFVSEEVGWGVVPAYPIGRKFRDRLGQVTRRIGAIANPVYLVTGGHVLNLSILGTPLGTPLLY